MRGHRIKEWKAGLHWYWPVVTTYKLMTIVRQTQLIQSKVVMTKDLRSVTVGALVTYFVDDVVIALTKIADLPSDVIERSQGAILSEVSLNTLADIHAGRAEFNRKVTERISNALNGYGVKILQAQLTEFAPSRAFTLSGHVAVGQYSLWTGY